MKCSELYRLRGHGSQEVGKGLKDRILKDAGIKKEGGRS
jgi:hypothetical protein